MSHGKHKQKYPLVGIIVSASISLIALLAGVWVAEASAQLNIMGRLVVPLMRLMVFIAIGLAVGQWIEAREWTRFLSVFARPLFRFSHLGDRCSATFTTAFFSGVAANSMLVGFYHEEAISRKQLILTNLINQFPVFFLHLPTTFFIIIPLTGLAGFLYLSITFCAVLLRTAVLILYGHWHLQTPKDVAKGETQAEPSQMTKGDKPSNIWQQVLAKLPRRLIRIAVYVVPIYIIVFFANALGFFAELRNWMATFVTTSFIPMESLSVVILSFAAEFTSGFAAAGALMNAGILTMKQTVLALLVGNVLAFPVRALRHQLPRYLGIFAPKMGMQLLLLGQGARISSIVIVGLLYYHFG